MGLSTKLHNAGIAVGAVATTVLATVPDAAMTVWSSSPELFKAWLPEPYIPVVSGFLTFLVAVSRVVKAKKAKGVS